MKKWLIGILVLGSISTYAFECKVGPDEKVIKISESGDYITRDAGYVYAIKYDDKDEYLSLMIEGGPSKLNVTHEAYGPKKSYLSLGKKGKLSDIAISCD